MTNVGTSELCKAKINGVAVPPDRATVAVVIPVFNQARFLADAITSVLAQSRPAHEIIVVDDGSTDNPAAVVARFSKVQLIVQKNRGGAAARNVGLRRCSATHIVFLDADDRLTPTALQASLACITRRPECAFVYGGVCFVSEDGSPIGYSKFIQIDGDARHALLRDNIIGGPSGVLFRRDCLLEVNGFDEDVSIRLCDDYDLYLRIAQKYPITGHPEIVAEYRKHRQNASADLKKMYLRGGNVLDRYKRRIASDATALAILEKRQSERRGYYARRMIMAAAADWHECREFKKTLLNLAQAARLAPLVTMRALLDNLSFRAIGQFVNGPLCRYLPDHIVILGRFISHHKYIPYVKNPRAFSEWMLNKKLFDRDPLLPMTADKFAVRDFVRERFGEKILIPLLQVIERVEDINLDRLPDQFVLKPAHGTGVVEIVTDKSLVNKDKLKARLRSWLQTDFYKSTREWQYQKIPRRIIVEAALFDNADHPLPEYKFYVVKGTVRMIHVDVGQGSQRRRSLFDRTWKLLNVTYRYPPAGDLDRPLLLDEMISIAEKLGRDFSFARIDLYLQDNKIYFDGIEQAPRVENEIFDPRDFDTVLGEILRTGPPIPARYRATFDPNDWPTTSPRLIERARLVQ